MIGKMAMLILMVFFAMLLGGCASEADKEKEAREESERRLKVNRPWNC